MTDEEIKVLFENNSDCYADTWEDNHDTIPPVMVEGPVVMAMTFETFKKVYKAAMQEVVEKEKVLWNEVHNKWSDANTTWPKFINWLKENYSLIPKQQSK